MKYWRGYLTAAIFAAFTGGLMKLAQDYQMLADMVYPYVTRTLQGMLAAWTSGSGFLVWQAVVMVAVVVALAGVVVALICRRGLIRWVGWVLAAVSVVFFLHTGIYGLNRYANPIDTNLSLEQVELTRDHLQRAAVYYRDKANELAVQMPRDEQGTAEFSDFDTLAGQTGNGFRRLMLDRSYSVFGGEYVPVKQLGWSDIYSSMGITGVTVPLTGEAAVNPQTPGAALPFTMAREMARRLCISRDNEAEFSAALACCFNESPEYRYSGYFMAYRFCRNALQAQDPAAAAELEEGCAKEFIWDMNAYDQFFAEKRDETAVEFADKANSAYDKANSGEEADYSPRSVSELLTLWYVNEHEIEEEVEVKFDPFDETQVDLTGIGNAKPAEPAPEEDGE